MSRLLIRILVAVACAAVIGAGATIVKYARHPDLILEIDRGRPSFVSGLYAAERDGDRTFAWSGERMIVRLSGLDRRTAWTCTARIRGARSESSALPRVTFAVDGDIVTSVGVSNEFADIAAVVPARLDQAGATVVLTITPTFKPGGGDPRELGVQVETFACQPARGWAWPPMTSIGRAAIASAAVAAAIAAAGVSVPLSIAMAAISGVGQAYLLVRGGAVFSTFPNTMLWLALGTALAIVVIGRLLTGGARASAVAAAAMALAAVGGYLKLLALVHPSKALVDALFQAHRLEWVLAGRYFFTQPMPDGVTFPYAIGLYAVAAPLTRFVPDHVALLRGVVSVADALAAGLLYWMLTREWRDRAAGIVAVVLFGLAPVSYVVVGNGNLTNAFGQCMAVVTLALVAAGVLGQRAWLGGIGVMVIATLAVLSHVSTVALLVPTLLATAVLYRVIGGRVLGAEAWRLFAVTVLAVVLAVGLYYRHFADVYRDALVRVRANASAPVVSGPEMHGSPGDARAAPVAALTRQLSWWERAGDVVDQTSTSLGWPILLLAVIGTWRTMRAAGRDRLSLLLLAWIGVWVAFVTAGTLTRVDTEYQRYASEFMGRVNLATYPAAVILAARGATWPWARTGWRAWWLRTATGALCVAAAVIGARAWMGWVQ